MNGMATPNLAQTNSERYSIPDQMKLECPDGNDWKASLSLVDPAVRQICQVTMIGIAVFRLSPPKPPTRHLAIDSGEVSGLQTESR